MDTLPTIENTEVIPINNGKIFVIVPFYIDGKKDNTFSPIEDSIITESDSCLWQKTTSPLTNEGESCPIYAHIMSFLQNGENGVHDNDDLITYGLSEKSDIVKKFWNRFSRFPHTIHTKEKEILFQFEQGNTTIDTPHLFISPTTRIGLLSFGLYLNTTSSMPSTDDLISLNYELHNIGRPSKCTTDKLSIDNNTPTLNEKIREQQEQQFQTLRSFINPHREKKQDNSTNFDFSWNICTLIELMSHGINNIRFFEPKHIHTFLYCGITDTKKEYTVQHIRNILYRLSHNINKKILLPENVQNDETLYLQTFDNIYISTAIEGTAFLNISNGNNIFTEQLYDQSIKTRYLWIYILAVIQRYSLRNIDQQLVKLVTNDFKKANGRDTENKSKRLWTIIKNINKIKIHCHYTDVSIYSQHNNFYNQCCEKLNINATYREIDAKLSVLHQTIDNDELVEQKNRAKYIDIFLIALAVSEAVCTIYAIIEAFQNHGCIQGSSYIGIFIMLLTVGIFLIKKK